MNSLNHRSPFKPHLRLVSPDGDSFDQHGHQPLAIVGQGDNARALMPVDPVADALDTSRQVAADRAARSAQRRLTKRPRPPLSDREIMAFIYGLYTGMGVGIVVLGCVWLYERGRL